MHRKGKYISPVFEEILKEREKKREEISQKLKKRFANIIQTNQREKELEHTKDAEDIQDSDSSDIGSNLKITPTVPNSSEVSVVPLAEPNCIDIEDQSDEDIKEIDSSNFSIEEQKVKESITTKEGEFYEVEKILDKKILN